MKLLTKSTDYAIRALLALAKKKNSFLSARDISESQGIPYQFLRRILQKLLKHNLVKSREGGGGGFKINKSANLINVTAIVEVFQGNIQLAECMFRKKLCGNRNICILRNEMKRIEKLVDKEFKGITITKLLNSNNKGG